MPVEKVGAGYAAPPHTVVLDNRDPYQMAANIVQNQALTIMRTRLESARRLAGFRAEQERRRV